MSLSHLNTLCLNKKRWDEPVPAVGAILGLNVRQEKKTLKCLESRLIDALGLQEKFF